ncbi:MAG: hypothetical protein OEX04_16450 [Acidimicrobiia bacterium]|nr:hypothetical protein [Acidimicrobiia bacterium]MDH4309059.1 hypothetical protein [Acidimicrobiia bacterium]MDH5293924.1 hypothetical protein [Acidimicrobiia bacterium]
MKPSFLVNAVLAGAVFLCGSVITSQLVAGDAVLASILAGAITVALTYVTIRNVRLAAVGMAAALTVVLIALGSAAALATALYALVLAMAWGVVPTPGWARRR